MICAPALHETKPTLTLLARPGRSAHDPRIIANHQTRAGQGRLVSLTERAKHLNVAVALKDMPDRQLSSGSHKELSQGKFHIASVGPASNTSLRDAFSILGDSKDIPHRY